MGGMKIRKHSRRWKRVCCVSISVFSAREGMEMEHFFFIFTQAHVWLYSINGGSGGGFVEHSVRWGNGGKYYLEYRKPTVNELTDLEPLRTCNWGGRNCSSKRTKMIPRAPARFSVLQPGRHTRHELRCEICLSVQNVEVDFCTNM